MNKRLLIYVSMPLISNEIKEILKNPNADDIHNIPNKMMKNILKAIKIGEKIIEKGHFPFIPHLSAFMYMFIDKCFPMEFWYRYDLEILDRCDAILIIGESEGTRIEEHHAYLKGMKIFRSLDEIQEVKEEK